MGATTGSSSRSNPMTASGTMNPSTSGYAPTRTRKRNADTQGPVEVIDLTGDDAPTETPTEMPTKMPKDTGTPQKRQRKNSSEPKPERRAKPFRKQPPKLCLDRLGRSRSQR